MRLIWWSVMHAAYALAGRVGLAFEGVSFNDDDDQASRDVS